MFKKAIVYGAGNIGRGFIGQLFSLSGYEVVFLDINREVIDRLNDDGRYPIRLVGAGQDKEVFVERVRGVDSKDADAAAAEIASADILATAVGANILPKIAPTIAAGLELRWNNGNAAPLNILICENLMHADKVLEALLLERLPKEHHVLLHESIGLVEASIGRMVPMSTAAMQEGNPLRVWAEPYAELPIDLDGFKGPMPEIIGMKPFSPFGFYIERKLYMHNMSHATLAYLGRLSGYEYIWQAARDSRISDEARGALAESAEALSRKYGIPEEELSVYSEDLLKRFDNPQLGDTVQRVGHDPVRKLAPGDRLSGAVALCMEQGILPVHICVGIAAALHFKSDNDAASLEIQKMILEKGLQEALPHYCGIDSNGQIFQIIINNYTMYKHLADQ